MGPHMTSQKETRNAMLGVGLFRPPPPELTAVNGPAPTSPPPELRDRVRAGAVGAVSRSLDQFQNDMKAAQALAASGAAVVELEPKDIDGSILKDRIEINDHDLAALIASIRQDGQQVPILVRQVHSAPVRYQVAYGHRRLAACRALGRPVLAVVRSLTDRDLLIAQGQENSARRDLSYIERALFAFNLEKRGVDREGIMAALSTDKTELSRLISVARTVPDAIVKAIGPAPKAGRPRWLALAQRLAEPKAERKFRALQASPEFEAAATDRRFDLAFALVGTTSKAREKAQSWTSSDGKDVVRISRSDTATTLEIDEVKAPQFGQFLLDHLSSLYDAFKSRTEPNGNSAGAS
jgi:ParB family transcriptional regulator, chromosome partitioning protein